MGVELRNGRTYFYSARRVNGRVVKEYVGPLTPSEAAVERRAAHRAAVKQAARRRRSAAERDRIDQLHAAATHADRVLSQAAAVVLAAAGFHRHKRQWRRRRGEAMASKGKKFGGLMAALLGSDGRNGPDPMIEYRAGADDHEATDLFAKSRAGDRDAIDKLPDLLDARKWWDWIGQVDRQATTQAIKRLCGGDPVWTAGVVDRANKVLDGLLGEKPTMAERLLARRVQVAWLATVALELEASVRPPRDPALLAHLDRRLSSATKRLADATKALATVRRLQSPRVVQNTAVIGGSVNVIGAASTGLPSPI